MKLFHSSSTTKKKTIKMEKETDINIWQQKKEDVDIIRKTSLRRPSSIFDIISRH